MKKTPELSFVTVHGHRRAYLKTGSGPALVLLHGVGDNHHTWDSVVPALAKRFTVIAPDMLGHGESDKPRADYSFGGFANGLRDLLTILGIDRATIVGHSLGGAIGMQFAYQYPERTERLMLVASGGLGPEVTPLLKAITLPGFPQVVRAMTMPGVRQAVQTSLRVAGKTVGRGNGAHDLVEVADILDSWRDPAALRAVRHVVRNGVDMRGQIITHRDRAYLSHAVPMAVLWGTDDRMVPVDHARHLETSMPAATVRYVEGAGHFPHSADPAFFVDYLTSFIAETEPATYSRAKWRAILVAGDAGSRLHAVPDAYGAVEGEVGV